MTTHRRFLTDANLSSRSRHWQSPQFESVRDAGWDDAVIWQYATQRNLVVVTKDVDFEDYALRHAGPQVILSCTGNMRRQVFRVFLSETWPQILEALEQPGVRLVRVYADRIESS